MTKTAPRVGLALAILLTIVLGVWPSPARADGDPASDVLANQVLFLPAAARISKLEELRLASLIDAANHDALPIRVAIIASPSDLGAVTELWDQPRAYARFLGLELALTGQDGVLVVMPDGVGFYSPGHSAPATYALVGRVASGHSGPALVNAAQAAVMSIARSRPRPSARPRAAGRRGAARTDAVATHHRSRLWVRRPRRIGGSRRRLPLLHSLALRPPDAGRLHPREL